MLTLPSATFPELQLYCDSFTDTKQPSVTSTRPSLILSEDKTDSSRHQEPGDTLTVNTTQLCHLSTGMKVVKSLRFLEPSVSLNKELSKSFLQFFRNMLCASFCTALNYLQMAILPRLAVQSHRSFTNQ